MELQLRRIVVPTDFSSLAEEAARAALAIAERSGAEIVLLYADPFLPPPHFLATQVDELSVALSDSKRLAAEELEKWRARMIGDRVTSSSVVIEDLPVAAIIDWTAANGVDLIVMGTHGRGGFNRMLLGSVSERVLRETVIPLLLVRPETAHPESTRILCPVNSTPAAHRALDYAVSFASSIGGEVTLLHVVERTDDSAEERKTIEQWVSQAGTTAVRIETLVRHGNAAEQIITAAREAKAGMIILASQHRRFFDTTFIGSTTVRITRHAEAPVLVVPAGPLP